jgi:hypothetical protein
MGQAKQRSAEIAALKAAPTTVHFFAIRHTQYGFKQVVRAQVQLTPNRLNNKKALLREICLKDWLHTPPVEYIAEYLLQTTSYQLMAQQQFQMTDRGYVINFHEVDQELSNDGLTQYSCRQVAAMSLPALEQYAAKFAAELNVNGEYSIKMHTE